MSAIDGATSTKWQPAFAANLTAVTVSFGPETGQLVSGFKFDWAQAPPVNATVIFHNKTLDDPAQAYASGSGSGKDYQVVSMLSNITLSNPYEEGVTDLDAIAIPVGNTTNVTLSSPVPAAKFASLLIVGNQALDEVDIKAGNGTGATVAEWAIIGQSRNETQSGANAKRAMNVRAAAAMAGSRSFMERRYKNPSMKSGL
jgi:hypothetical protein